MQEVLCWVAGKTGGWTIARLLLVLMSHYTDVPCDVGVWGQCAGGCKSSGSGARLAGLNPGTLVL